MTCLFRVETDSVRYDEDVFYVVAGNYRDAVVKAEEALKKLTTKDVTIRAIGLINSKVFV